VCSLQQRAVNKLASKFGVSSDDAMLKQIKISDASDRPLLLFTPFEPADLTSFLSAAQMAAMMPHTEPEQPSSRLSTDMDPETPATDSPTALAQPLASVHPDEGGSSTSTSSAAVAISRQNGDDEVAARHTLVSDTAIALHPNAVAGAIVALHSSFSFCCRLTVPAQTLAFTT
jgi:hypothetical protein